MQNIYDTPTYPELGNIYPGDYYEALPYDEFIDKNQKLPEGKKVFDIRDFGARPEKDLLNTEAFLSAAAACEKAGGGVILVAGGSYCMGTVYIPSHTTLFIAADSEIKASRNVDLLLAKEKEQIDDRKGESSEGAFVRIKNAEDVTITGGGRINGSGEWYVYEPRELPALVPFETSRLPRRDQAKEINTIPGTIRYYYRQRIRYSEDKYGEGKSNLNRPAALVWVQDSKNVTFDNIILYDSMSWTLHIECCENITVKNMVIDDNRHVANSDGVDINASDNVLVDHCFISCADDGIVIKNPIRTGRAMTHVHVKRCTVVTVMNAFKIGTETANDISDILVEDCTFCMPDIYPGSVSGISLESCDGTNLSDVTIRNITMDKIICPLYICLNKRNRYNEPYTDNVGENRYWGGSIKNICIENIHADNAEVPAILTGYETTKNDGSVVRRPLENITVNSYHVIYRDNKEIIEIPETFDEFLEDYPESNAHGDVDAYGIWARHIDNLVLEDINVVPRSCNTRKAICLYDVNNKN